MYQLTRRKMNSRSGITMAEMLSVVAIIVILAGVAFIAVINYQRSMAQLERDNIAKEIFIAAQNHLTEAKGENYLNTRLLSGLSESESSDAKAAALEAVGSPYSETSESGEEEVSYYIVSQHGTVEGGKGNYIFEQMLPFGSVDETVRLGGNYVVRYQPEVGKVLEVFYCSNNDSFGHVIAASECSTLFTEYSGTDKREARRNYGDKRSVLGWYGGEGLESLGFTLTAPEIEIENGNILKVTSTDSNSRTNAEDGIVLKLLVRGKLSGKEKELYPDASVPKTGTNPLNTDTFILDDITDSSTTDNKHFSARFEEFIPGEDLEIRAVTFSTLKLSNIAESVLGEVNSLFDSLSDGNEADSEYTLNSSSGTITISPSDDSTKTVTKKDVANIRCIRHLENLDDRVSNLDAYDSDNKLDIREAVQIADLYWDDAPSGMPSFTEDAGYSVYYSSSAGEIGYIPSTNNTGGSTENGGLYKPVELPISFSYDGCGYSVTGINVNVTRRTEDGVVVVSGNAGMFGSGSGSTLENLKLVDFDIKSAGGNAGALAGSLSEATVKNVIVVNDPDSSDSAANTVIVSGANAGGLIGRMAGGSVSYSAAAVKVSGSECAGGLIGIAPDEVNTTTVSCCYSAGQTEAGEYYKGHDGVTRKTGNSVSELYNVTAEDGGTAGGLIGSVAKGDISNCYTTSSVSAGNSGTAGGFVGSAAGAIRNCYCTGLVGGKLEVSKDGRSGDNAFIGTGDPTLTGNHYYSVINEVPVIENDKVVRVEYKLSGKIDTDAKGNYVDKSGITPFDDNTDTLKGFTENGAEAHPYDSFLTSKFAGGSDALYYLKTVDELAGSNTSATKGYFVADHYGDWPAPEIMFINN